MNQLLFHCTVKFLITLFEINPCFIFNKTYSVKDKLWVLMIVES